VRKTGKSTNHTENAGYYDLFKNTNGFSPGINMLSNSLKAYTPLSLHTRYPIIVITLLSGILLSALILFVIRLPGKWIFSLVLVVFFPLFVVIIGSLERSLQAVLIFSLSATIDVNPGWSEAYTALTPGVSIPFTSIILLFLYILWLARIYLRKSSVKIFPKVTIPFMFILIFSGLSIFTAYNSAYVLAIFPRALTAFLLFIYTANFLKSKEDKNFLIKCLAITVAFSGALGISQHIAGTSFNLGFMGARDVQQVMDYSYLNISRVSGLLNQPNNFAYFLDGLLPILILCALAFNGFKLRVLCYVSFSVGIVSLVLTFSRGGGIALIISLLVIFFFLFKKNREKRMHGFLVRFIVFGLIALFLIAPFLSRIIIRATKDDYGAAYARIPMAQTALRVISKNPLKGVGLGNYKLAVPLYDSSPHYDKVGGISVVHNMYFLMAAELGLPALFLFIWISIIIFRRGIRTIYSEDIYKSFFTLGLISGLVGIYLHGFFEDVFFGGHRFLLLSFLWGLVMAISHCKITKENKRL